MKTSFGSMEKIWQEGNRPIIEYLIFENEGRGHKHKEYESFFVLKGSGKVVSGNKRIDVEVGDLVTIPPLTSHWMIPNEGSRLEGFIWYHDQQINMLDN